MESTSRRTHGGIAGEDRQAERRAQLIEAGLALLGARDGDRNLTVRGVCPTPGWPRGTSTTSRPSIPTRAKTHAGLSRLVRTIAEDPRKGFLLFSPERRAASARWFQALTSWLDGTLELSEEDLVVHCTEVFLTCQCLSTTDLPKLLPEAKDLDIVRHWTSGTTAASPATTSRSSPGAR